MGYLSGTSITSVLLPVGIEAELDVEMESLVLLEAAVVGVVQSSVSEV